MNRRGVFVFMNTTPARVSSLRELRGQMRAAALQWRTTPPRQKRKRYDAIGRAVFFRETARILAHEP